MSFFVQLASDLFACNRFLDRLLLKTKKLTFNASKIYTQI